MSEANDPRQSDPLESPKKANGRKKPPLHLVPTSALIHAAMAFRDGAWTKGYGPYNWRTKPVDITTYVDAAERHLRLYLEGQRLTSDSKVHNLGAVIACCAILLDSEEFGNLIDDRPPSFDFERVMDDWTVGRGLPE